MNSKGIMQGASLKSGYTVVAILRAQQGKESEVKQLLTDIVEPCRNEKICLEYRLHQDLNDPTQFVLYEIWESKQAHENQFSKGYIKTLGEKLPSLLVKPYHVVFAEQIK